MAIADKTNLIAYWRLDEASGTRVDAHGSFDLTDNGTVSTQNGRVGNPDNFLMPSTGFNGSSQYLTHAHHSDLAAQDENITIACWFWKASNGNHAIMSHWIGGTNQRGYLLYTNGSHLVFNVSSTGGNQNFVQIPYSASGRWDFVVAWHDADANEIGIQHNGRTPDIASFSAGIFNNTADFSIGSANNGGMLLPGRAAHASLWKRVLTADERLELWNRGMGIDYPFASNQLIDNVGTLVSNETRANNLHNVRVSGREQVSQWTSGGTTYEAVTYWAPAFGSKLVVGKREAGGAWTLYTMDGTGGRPDITITGNDNHDVTVLGIDPDGYIHIAYDMHSNALTYRKSDAPISTWTGGLTAVLSMLGTNENSVTYPTFFNDPAGTLYFMFRRGSTANGLLYFYEYDESTTSWAAAVGAEGLLINGQTVRGMYWSLPPVFDSDFGSGGKMHLAWVWREAPGSGNNRNVCYVAWDGTNWTKADGTAQTVPITDGNAEVAHAVPTGSGLGAFPDIYSDSNGRPHITFKKEDGGGFSQVWHFRYTGSSWSTPVALTNWDQGFSEGFGDPTPMIVINRTNNEAYIFYVGYGEGTGFFYYRSTDFTNWTKETITVAQMGYWTPIHNMKYWLQNGKMQFSIAPWLTEVGAAAHSIRIIEHELVSGGGDGDAIPRPGVLVLGTSGML